MASNVEGGDSGLSFGLLISLVGVGPNISQSVCGRFPKLVDL